MKTSKLNGHKIEHNGDEWIFSDTKESTIETHAKRPCGHCGMHKTKDEHDHCIANLKGVDNACCGHGCDDDAYIQYSGGLILRGGDAISAFKGLKSVDS